MFFNRWMRRRQKQHVFSLAPNWLNNSSVSVFQLRKQLINNYPIIISRFWLHGTCKPNEQEKRASEPLSEAQVHEYQPPNLSPRPRYMSISLQTSHRGPGTRVSASEPLSEGQVHEYQPPNLSLRPRYMSISLRTSLRGPGTWISAFEPLSEAQVYEYHLLNLSPRPRYMSIEYQPPNHSPRTRYTSISLSTTWRDTYKTLHICTDYAPLS